MNCVYRAFATAGLSVVLLSVGANPSVSNDYPVRTIELVVPFAPGGPADVATRIVQPFLSASLRVPVVISNKPGAGGAVAMDLVAKAKPDGYTLAATSNSTLVTVPATNAKVAYGLTSFAAIGSFAVDYQAIISRPDARWRTIEDFIAFARKNPGKLSYGSSGTGGISYFNMEILKMMEKLDIAHIPYQGTGPVLNAILGGHVDVATSAMGAFVPLVQSKSLEFLIVTAPQRLPEMPAVPTMIEKGFKSATLNTVMQMFAPAGTPDAALGRLRNALEAAMRDPAVKQAMHKAGLLVDYQSPAATMSALEEEIASVRLAMRTLKVN